MAEIDTSLYPDRLRDMDIPGLRGRAPVVRESRAVIEVVESADIREMCRSAVPGLVRRAVEMAAGSESLREVLDVLKEVADRGYGKAAQSVEVRVTSADEGAAALRELVAAGVMDAAVARQTAREIGFEWVDAEVVMEETEPDTQIPAHTEVSQEIDDI